MGFASILGQERAVSLLRRAWVGERLAQAYCFHGPAGAGKRRTALALAQAVNCLAEKTGGAGGAIQDACGACLACRKIASGIHPDVTLVRPEDKTVITIDQIRTVAMRASLHPYEGKSKVFILDPADLLQEPAANALLKTLEEPTQRTLFVLVTASPDALLPTLLSRCQGVRFDRLGEGSLRAVLEEHGRPPEEAAAAAALADGSAERALALDLEEVRATRQRVVQHVWGALGSPVSALTCAESLARDRETLESALEILVGFTREVALGKVGGEAPVSLQADGLTEVWHLARQCSVPAILGIYEAQAEAQRALARNANARFTAERMLLCMRRAVGGAQPVRVMGAGTEGGRGARGSN
jgi:DNA polymerase-3 subunit delta'